MPNRTALHYKAFVSGLFSLLLAACSSGRVDGPGAETLLTKEVSGTVQGWTKGRANVRAITGSYGKVYRDVSLAGGVLGADGNFTLKLPPEDEIPREVFYSAKSLFSCIKSVPGSFEGETGSVEVVPADLDYVYLQAFGVFLPDSDASYGGVLEYGSYDTETSTETSRTVEYLYATADGTVKGRCTTSAGDYEGGYDTSNSYDLTLKKGWNEVIFTNVTSPGNVTFSRQTGSLPEGFVWRYLDYSDLPNDGPPKPK